MIPASQLVAVCIFLAMLVIILTDWVHRTIAAWVGANQQTGML